MLASNWLKGSLAGTLRGFQRMAGKATGKRPRAVDDSHNAGDRAEASLTHSGRGISMNAEDYESPVGNADNHERKNLL